MVNSSLRTCEGVESTEHFFFKCNKYDSFRKILLNSLPFLPNLTLLNILLCDDFNVSYETNIVIFDAIHITLLTLEIPGVLFSDREYYV